MTDLEKSAADEMITAGKMQKLFMDIQGAITLSHAETQHIFTAISIVKLYGYKTEDELRTNYDHTEDMIKEAARLETMLAEI